MLRAAEQVLHFRAQKTRRDLCCLLVRVVKKRKKTKHERRCSLPTEWGPTPAKRATDEELCIEVAAKNISRWCTAWCREKGRERGVVRSSLEYLF